VAGPGYDSARRSSKESANSAAAVIRPEIGSGPKTASGNYDLRISANADRPSPSQTQKNQDDLIDACHVISLKLSDVLP
jgi:hypothetical protein